MGQSKHASQRLAGDKGTAQVAQADNGQFTLAWLSTGTTDAESTDQAPQLIEDLSSQS